MTRPGCKSKKHTPYVSEAQTTAGNIALAAKKGKIPKSKLKGASKQMARGMTMEELESHSKEAKGKKLPRKKRQSEVKAYVKERQEQRNRRIG